MVRQSLENISPEKAENCSSCWLGGGSPWDIYQDYVDGKKELKEIRHSSGEERGQDEKWSEYIVRNRVIIKGVENIIQIKVGAEMKTKKNGNNWTAYYDPDTKRYFAEIMYTSREGREQYDSDR